MFLTIQFLKLMLHFWHQQQMYLYRCTQASSGSKWTEKKGNQTNRGDARIEKWLGGNPKSYPKNQSIKKEENQKSWSWWERIIGQESRLFSIVRWLEKNYLMKMWTSESSFPKPRQGKSWGNWRIWRIWQFNGYHSRENSEFLIKQEATGDFKEGHVLTSIWLSTNLFEAHPKVWFSSIEDKQRGK